MRQAIAAGKRNKPLLSVLQSSLDLVEADVGLDASLREFLHMQDDED